jgi:hypothetical protein
MIEELKKLLDAHDWTFQRSDDHRKWLRGLDQQKRIKALASKIGPEGIQLYQSYYEKLGA